VEDEGIAVTLATPESIRTLQRKLYRKAKQEPAYRFYDSGLDPGACLTVKSIGKPCRGKLYARFDEGGLANGATVSLFRHRYTKGAETAMRHLRHQ
jgi:hypothetical protein